MKPRRIPRSASFSLQPFVSFSLQAFRLSGFFLSLFALHSSLFASLPGRPAKVPFRVLHSNDTVNINSRIRDRPTEDKDIRDSVDMTAGFGIDVHMIEIWGWVPWWQSDVLPIAEHAAWKKSNAIELNAWETYTLKGGDLLRVFVEQCRKAGQSPFASFRMNDQHHLIWAGVGPRGVATRSKAKNQLGEISGPEFNRKVGVSRFYIENPQWRIGDDGVADLRGQLSMDFAVPQVREYRLKQIRELVDKYDIDGLQLDFMRHPVLFNQRKSTSAQRAHIITGLVRQVREILDAKGARSGRHLWLALRIPAYPETFDRMGIDLPKLASGAGVDIINASSNFHTDQQAAIAQLRGMLPAHVALHAELHYISTSPYGGGKASARRCCTPLQLLTSAHLARRRGADGLSTFNFQYYRYVPLDGHSVLPPYDVFKNTPDLDWLAQQPQHYIASGANNAMRPKSRHFPTSIRSGESKKVFIDMTPPAGGWRSEGKMRIQSRRSLDDSVWRARLNGTLLEPASDVSEPFPTPYPLALGNPGDYRAWLVPAALLKDGENIFEISYKGKAGSASLFFMDVALPAPAPSATQTTNQH